MTLEQSREVWGFATLDSWKQDVAYAIRGWRKSPGFALAVIGSLGLGLGLNTTLFTVFNAYVLRPYAVRDPYSLYSFTWLAKSGQGHLFSQEDFDDLKQQRTVVTDVFTYDNFGAEVAGRTMFAEVVSENYFEMLGVGMELGRPMMPGDHNVMVMGYEAWRNKFGGDPGIVGRKLHVRGTPFEVIGVASRKFTGLEGVPIGVWLPLSMRPSMKDGATSFGLRFVARLRPGLTEEQAKAGLLTWARRRWPEAIRIVMASRARSIPISKEAAVTFIPIFTAFGMVLLIACANVSNMMLARALARQREIAIRVSLGASRGRLVRQLLTESVLLAIPSAAAGFLISEGTIAGARRLLFATVPPAFGRLMAIENLAPDWRVFGYLLGAAVATALLFGLVPAIQTTRSRLVEANRGDFSSDYRPSRLRSALVVTQVAVCSVLLVCTAIVLRSEGRVARHPIGLETAGVWDLRMMERFQEPVAARLAAEPGVEAVAFAWRAPLYGTPREIRVVPSGAKDAVTTGYNFVSGSLFPLFRVPMMRGRTFTREEADGQAPVAVVSESAARQFWPGREAVGQSLAIPRQAQRSSFDRMPGFASAQVVGVARDATVGVVAVGGDEVMVYFPTTARGAHNDSVLARVGGTRAEAQRRLEAALAQVGPSIADMINSMDDVLEFQVYPFRVTWWVAGFLGGVALLLTVSGIYGVMSYVVSQRRKEIGIRVALGAGTADVLGMVLRQSGRLAGIGAAIGIGMALSLAPLIAHQIEAIRPYDWLPYVATAAIVVAAAGAASWGPSKRALHVDPAVTLRCD